MALDIVGMLTRVLWPLWPSLANSILSLDVVKGSHQLLSGSSVWYQADFFEHKVAIDLFDNEFRISMYLKCPDSLLYNES